MKTEKEDQLVRELMGKSANKMPFSDFEEKLMEQIHNEVKATRSFRKNVNLSWFFFIGGTCLGLLLSVVATQIKQTIFGLPAQQMIVIFQVVFSILLLSQFDKLIELTRKKRNDCNV